MRRKFQQSSFVLILLVLVLSACQATMKIAPDASLQTQTAEAASLPTLTPPPSPTPGDEALSDSSEQENTSFTAGSGAALTPTSAPTTVTPTQSLTPTATATMDLENMEANCRTPMSLMLHSAYGAERMAALADEIQKENLNTITYSELFQTLARGNCPAENDILVSLDDLGSSWLRYDFMEMIKVFTERNLVLTVGVVTKGPQNEDNWEYFREIESLGIEIASHSMNHYDLSIITEDQLEEEVAGSYEIICENMGTCPRTLIIPFGRLDEDGRVREAAKMYDMLVIIQGGLEISGSPPYLLGRIPPDNEDQALTISLLEATFGSRE